RADHDRRAQDHERPGLGASGDLTGNPLDHVETNLTVLAKWRADGDDIDAGLAALRDFVVPLEEPVFHSLSEHLVEARFVKMRVPTAQHLEHARAYLDPHDAEPDARHRRSKSQPDIA